MTLNEHATAAEGHAKPTVRLVVEKVCLVVTGAVLTGVGILWLWLRF